MSTKFLFSFYFLGIIALFVYSFTQVDLNLTLTSIPYLHTIQTTFQEIGYFQRQTSTYMYVSIIALLFVVYGFFLRLAFLKKISTKSVWLLIGASTLVLTFSYNAFSYDLFNYIFDAKIVTNYQQNPYFQIAQDYPQDPMVNFMRWTHRTYPYGPLWLGITVPISFVGFQYFIPTLFMFKILMALCFLGTTYYIYKIAQLKSEELAIWSLVLFGLNPFVLIESVVSAHNDIVMMFFSVLSLYLFLQKRFVVSGVSLVISIGIKYITAFSIPFYLLYSRAKDKKSELPYLVLVVCMIIPVILASMRTNFQPWYLLFVLPYVSLLQYKKETGVGVFIVTLFALFEYIPFLYLGTWDQPVPTILQNIRITGLILAGLIIGLFGMKRYYKNKNARGTIS